MVPPMPNLICCLICLLAIGSLAMDGPNSKRIAAGRTHFLLINKENEVTSFGYGDRGELGHGNIFHILDKEAPLKPIEIFKGKKPVAVEAGWGCSFVLLENGHIYSFGDNSRAQLGRNVGPLLHPGELEGLQNERLVEIAVGDHFGAALNDAGKVFVWGQYSQGQPSELACLKGRAIRKLAAGERLLVIDSDGDLWSVSEVLGTKELSCHRINEQDPLSEKIEQVAAGFSHVVILTKGGRVFSYGNNKHGQLGHGDYEQSMRPKEIMGLIDKKIVRVVAGDSFSAALCANGEVWWFGQLRIERNSVYSAILPHPTLLEGVPSNITDIAANFSSGTLLDRKSTRLN